MEGIRLGNDRQILQGQSYQSVWGSLKIFRGIGWVSKLVYYSSTACSAPPPSHPSKGSWTPLLPGPSEAPKAERLSQGIYQHNLRGQGQIPQEWDAFLELLVAEALGFIYYVAALISGRQFSSQKQCSILLLLIAVDQIVTLVSRDCS